MHADSIVRLILSALIFLFTTIVNSILHSVRANSEPLEVASISPLQDADTSNPALPKSAL